MQKKVDSETNGGTSTEENKYKIVRQNNTGWNGILSLF